MKRDLLRIKNGKREPVFGRFSLPNFHVRQLLKLLPFPLPYKIPGFHDGVTVANAVGQNIKAPACFYLLTTAPETDSRSGSYRLARPEVFPAAIASTSFRVVRLKSPGTVCFKAEAAVAN